jgi:two-component system chemotaxis response regulator CheB/chemosensory pili system protein ChpB (putative protein-glutamate methylesterase)
LLGGSGESGEQLRATLASLGAAVVYEAAADALDRDALERSHATVVVVNLDARNDPDLDGVYDLLDDERYHVVFNDADASRGLTGWDQARWVRHLAAKVLGGADIDPPRPADAEPIPMRRAAPVAMAADTVAPSVHAEFASAAPVREEAAVREEPARGELAHATIDWASEPMPQPPVAAEALPDFSLDLAADLVAEPAPPLARVAETAQVPAPHLDDDLLLDLGSLIELPDVPAPPVHAAPAAPVAEARSAHEPIDAIDLSDFGDFGLDAVDATSETAAAEHVLDALPSAAPAAKDAAVEEEALPDLAFDFERIDVIETPPVIERIEVPAVEAKTPPAKEEIAIPADWSLEAMLDDFADPPPAPAAPSSPAEFGIEKLTAAEYLAPDGGDAEPPIEVGSGLMLELVPLEEAVAPKSFDAAHENWVDPDAQAPKVRRVWVLGASIGGPEAVREFLAGLPRDYPALFLLAQHLGEEFVDMMARQLAQATPLTVRMPTHGERVGHGEVIVVPTSQRLRVDTQGVVVLQRDEGDAEFRPSIDRVLRDAADRFGSAAGAIVFSGMSSDAAEGCRYVASKGGAVYVQKPDSCVVSTMVDGVCDTGVVRFQGSPKELAEKLLAEAQ